MGCCYSSSPYSKRRYPRDPADYDEEEVPIKYFGSVRVGSNLVPDDIDGIPSTHIWDQLISNPTVLLYEAEIDHGSAYKKCRPGYICLINPLLLFRSLKNYFTDFICDEICCWLSKEYSKRTFFRIYSNRIEYNDPVVRFPWACGGCGSWNADTIKVNQFDRGAFGFTSVKCGVISYLTCCWPTYGGTVARHRCQCNGPCWNRMFTDCGGWWCDEWFCQMFFCTYRYKGLANPDEVAFAASIALQAYFEGRILSPKDMEKCIEYWYEHIAEQTDPIGRKRPVCCEPYTVPSCTCNEYYKRTHPERPIPYPDNDERITDRLKDVYKEYENERQNQIYDYTTYRGIVHKSTVCRGFGCRRCYGRKGCCFCTEGCDTCYTDNCGPTRRKPGDPAPPITKHHDIDDEWDASSVLLKVIGPPPANVVIKRWRYDPERNENYLDIYPPPKTSVNATALPPPT